MTIREVIDALQALECPDAEVRFVSGARLERVDCVQLIPTAQPIALLIKPGMALAAEAAAAE